MATGIVVLAAVLDLWFLVHASRERLSVQDGLMQNVDAATLPGDQVWDATGFALRREPAYRYWFLPLGVRLLVASGEIPPYTPAQMAASPPAAVIVDVRMFSVFREWPSTRRAVVQHYVPRWRNVWLPGASGVIAPRAVAAIDIWRSGDYRLEAGAALLRHPWFHDPVACAAATGPAAVTLMIDVSAPAVQSGIDAQRSGVRLDPRTPWRLRGGDRVYIRNSSADPVGFFLAPASAKRLFEPPPGGAPLADPLFELR